MVKERLCFEDFQYELVRQIENLDSSNEVRIIPVMKNNGIIFCGVNIISKNEKSNVIPTIYIDDFYDSYIKGDMEISEVVHAVLRINNMNRREALDLKEITNFEKVKEKLTIKLINTEKNKEFLQDVPHTEFLDMSAVYQIILKRDASGNEAITIKNELFKMYNIGLEELHTAAFNNQEEKEPVNITPISQKIEELKSMIDIDDEIEPMPVNDVFIVSNKTGLLGASEILHSRTLDKIAEIYESDYYILPSSLHEVLAMKATPECTKEDLRAMVREVNETQVESEEILSDNVYFYSTETGELTIA